MTQRKRRATLWPAGYLVVLLASAPLAAAPAERFCGTPQKPLLTVESTEVQSFGLRWIRRSMFVFTDGLVVDSQVVNEFDFQTHQLAALPVAAQIGRGTASMDNFAAFASALGAARPGLAHDCLYGVSDAGDYTEFRLTWYGKGKRKNTFIVSPNIVAPDCTQQINDLIERILRLRNEPPVSEILSWVP
jgi:hypothetical protein